MFGDDIRDVFTDNEIMERFEKIQEENPSNTFDENLEATKNELSIDAENYRSQNRTR